MQIPDAMAVVGRPYEEMNCVSAVVWYLGRLGFDVPSAEDAETVDPETLGFVPIYRAERRGDVVVWEDSAGHPSVAVLLSDGGHQFLTSLRGEGLMWRGGVRIVSARLLGRTCRVLRPPGGPA